MWQVINTTPFAAAQAWTRNLDGAETWLVVVRATFDVQPDGSKRVAAVQVPPVRTPLHWGDPLASSLRDENDFVLRKDCTDIVVDGSAHAAGGKPASSVDVGFRVGHVSKALRVFGDRYWGPTATRLSTPEPFTVQPIRYEHGFGGRAAAVADSDPDWYEANPVGKGYAKSRSQASGTAAPNVEYPDRLISSWSDRPPPASFGFVPSHWAPRARLAGTYDVAWMKDRQPLWPRDFQPEFFQSSPPDQRSKGFLVGGEPVELWGMSPRGTLKFSLPVVHLALRTRFHGGDRVDHAPPNLHTVILRPDPPSVTLVWHLAFQCHARVYQLESTRIDFRSEQRTQAQEDLDALLGP